MAINTNDGTGLKDLPAIPQIPDNVGKLDVKGIYDRVVQGLGAQNALAQNAPQQAASTAILGQQTAQANAATSLVPSQTAASLATNEATAAQAPLGTVIKSTEANKAAQLNQPDIDANVAKLNEDKLQSQLGAIYTKAGLAYGQSDANAIETIKNSNLMRLQNSPGGFVSTPINPDNPALGSLVTFMGPNGPENHVTLPSASYVSAQTKQQLANENERFVQDYADPSTGRVTGHSVLVDSAGNVHPSNRPPLQWDPAQGPPGKPFDQNEVDKLQASHGSPLAQPSTPAAPLASTPPAQGSAPPAQGSMPPAAQPPSAAAAPAPQTMAPVVQTPSASSAPVVANTPEEAKAAFDAGKTVVYQGQTITPPAPAAGAAPPSAGAVPPASGAAPAGAAPAIGHAPGQATAAAGQPNPQLLSKEDKEDVQELMAGIAAKQQMLAKVQAFQKTIDTLPGGQDPSGKGTFMDRSENYLASKAPDAAALVGIDAGQRTLAGIRQQAQNVMSGTKNVRNVYEFQTYLGQLPETAEEAGIKRNKLAATTALIQNDLARDQEALANITDRGMTPLKAQAEALKKHPGNVELPSF